MAKEPQKVKLVGGEEVRVSFSTTVGKKDLTFVRTGEKLICSVLTGDEHRNGVYFWLETVDGVYEYIGDVRVKEQEEEGVVSMHVFPGPAFSKRRQREYLDHLRLQFPDLEGDLKGGPFGIELLGFLLGKSGEPK